MSVTRAAPNPTTGGPTTSAPVAAPKPQTTSSAPPPAPKAPKPDAFARGSSAAASRAGRPTAKTHVPANAPSMSRSQLTAQLAAGRTDPSQVDGRATGAAVDKAWLARQNRDIGKCIDHPPNTTHADATAKSLKDLKNTDPAVGKALKTVGGKIVERALVDGVKTPRSTDVNGSTGILGQHQAERAAHAYGKLSAADKKAFDGLMQNAGKGANGRPAPGADAQTERALMLKALGAGHSVEDVRKFAEGDKTATPPTTGIRGSNKEQLVQQTTPYDLDGAGKDEGLHQEYGNSCAPTVTKLVQMENDPIACRSFEMAPPAERARIRRQEEMAILQQDKHLPISREQLQAYDSQMESINLQMGVVRDMENASGISTVSKDERIAVARYVNGNKKFDPVLLGTALSKMKNMAPPLNNPSQLAEVRLVSQNRGMKSATAYGNASSTTGLNYSMNKVLGTPTDLSASLDDIARHAGAGRQVPLRVTTADGKGGHALLVQSHDAAKGYLVSDPMSGKTQWFTKAEMTSGAFGTAFSIDQSQLDGYYTDINKL